MRIGKLVAANIVTKTSVITLATILLLSSQTDLRIPSSSVLFMTKQVLSTLFITPAVAALIVKLPN
jgi:hypothetical protein